MSGIPEPVPRPLLGVLRRAVADHGARERRRVYPPVLHVGWPGGRLEAYAAEPGDRLDHALRCDIAAALVRRARVGAPVAGAIPMFWLTRSGPLEAGDLDLAWLSAAATATAEAGAALTMVVVTRRGWFDPRSGTGREWQRLRAR